MRDDSINLKVLKMMVGSPSRGGMARAREALLTDGPTK
jgi:hypothetical protein